MIPVRPSHPATQRPRLGCGCTADSDARTCIEWAVWGRTPVDYGTPANEHGLPLTVEECRCRCHKEANHE